MYSACFGRKYRCPIESMVFDVFCVFWADVPISDRKRCFRSTASLRARSRAVSRRAPSLAAGTPHLPRRFRPYGVSRHLLRRLTWLGRYWAAIAVANPHGMLRFGIAAYPRVWQECICFLNHEVILRFVRRSNRSRFAKTGSLGRVPGSSMRSSAIKPAATPHSFLSAMHDLADVPPSRGCAVSRSPHEQATDSWFSPFMFPPTCLPPEWLQMCRIARFVDSCAGATRGALCTRWLDERRAARARGAARRGTLGYSPTPMVLLSPSPIAPSSSLELYPWDKALS